jgi:hypothetical protein
MEQAITCSLAQHKKESIMDIKQKLNAAYDGLQQLEIRATRGNMERLIFALNTLKEAYQEIDKNRKDEENNGEV